MSHDGRRLFLCRETAPKRIEGGRKFVRRMLPSLEVVIKEQTALRIPHELLHDLLTRGGSTTPARSIGGTIQEGGDLLQVGFCLIEKAVQANRRKVMRPRTIGAEAEGDIETRFAHATVAFVIVRSKGKPRYLVALGVALVGA